mmetsp:Transcript_6107/g.12241  ORF Transcript_6107/g.12241 Transcript_6107/m.12241 type:complete len:104 (-) Transcript_6107:1513-1824(-)
MVEAATNCPNATCEICPGRQAVFREDPNLLQHFARRHLLGRICLSMLLWKLHSSCIKRIVISQSAPLSILVEDFCANLTQVEVNATVALDSELDSFDFHLPVR